MDGRHEDEEIQTLLLPEMLSRNLDSIIRKDRLWKSEAGVNVLHIAFGFIEWADQSRSKKFAPLILLPVEINRVATEVGVEYWVSSENAAESNYAFIELLRSEYGIELPKYTGGEVESYFEKINNLSVSGLDLKLKRWVVCGLFPTNSIAMYQDLETKNLKIHENKLIRSLLIGDDDKFASVFGDERRIREVNYQQNIPFLVYDADSSQVKVIQEVLSGRNLVVEGPPGTGKSQTITNTIAAALYEKKRILFVAEKSAALEVVKSKLEACGLGEFILSLEAKTSTKKQVIRSIKQRIEMDDQDDVDEFDYYSQKYQEYRGQLNDYIRFCSAEFGRSGLSNYEVISHCIDLQNEIQLLEQKSVELEYDVVTSLDNRKYTELLQLVSEIQNASVNIVGCSKAWAIVDQGPFDPFRIDHIINQAKNASVVAKELIIEIDELAVDSRYLNPYDESTESILNVFQMIEKCCSSDLILKLIILLKDFKPPLLLGYLNSLSTVYDLHQKLTIEIDSKLSPFVSLFEVLKNVSKLVNKNLSSTEVVGIYELLNKYSDEVLDLRNDYLLDQDNFASFSIIINQIVTLDSTSRNIREQFHLNIPYEIDEIIEDIENIESAGFLKRLFSNKYKKSKVRYVRVSKGEFNRRLAINNLKNLANYCSEKKQLLCKLKSKHPFFSEIIFEGSDFQQYSLLCSYYKDVNSLFSGDENLDVVNYLLKKRGLRREIFSVVSNITEIKRYKINYEKVSVIVRSYEQLKSRINQFLSDKSVVFSAESMGKIPENISKLIGELKSTIDSVSGFQDIQEIIGFEVDSIDIKFKEALKQIFLSASNLNDEMIAYLCSILKMDAWQSFYPRIAKIQDLYGSLLNEIETLSELTKTNTNQWLSQDIRHLSESLVTAKDDKKGINEYSAYNSLLNKLTGLGFRAFVEIIQTNDYMNSNYSRLFSAMIFKSMVKILYRTYGENILAYKGCDLEMIRNKLAEVDRKLIILRRKKLRYFLQSKARPDGGNGVGKISEYTEMALLMHEINKKSRHIPVKQLTKRACQSLLELKPCWMVSPLAVAQYLDNNKDMFDLVIFDEASQLSPQNAIGALLRSKQMMVVGDQNQLPPSNFFQKISESDDIDDDFIINDESLLELAGTRYNPKQTLRWHYRSRHPSLINFSNHHIYEDGLIIFPSPSNMSENLGLKHIKVDGEYHAGLNPDEAEKLLNYVVGFMYKNPSLSLGIVTLNNKQKSFIEEEMMLRAGTDKHVLAYIQKWELERDGLEPFFVKNLENVQGDERDVIVIGTVYGPEVKGGRVYQRFGPINGVAGSRRLNVLLTRAKRLIVTVTSMAASDILIENKNNKGVEMLRHWLEYSASGELIKYKLTDKLPDSGFERDVIKVIEQLGCTAEPQVGVSGYFIDIGIRHPSWPNGFIMGVECDGATYHSSKSARDRDRLREEVLKQQGWHLYRIWSTDWFEDAKTEIEKLKLEIKTRLEQLKLKS